MASNSEYTISVVVDSDASGLDTGAQQAAQAIDDLSSSADSAGAGIDSALSDAGDAFSGVSSAASTAASDTSSALSGIADTAEQESASAASSLGDIPSAASEAAAGIDDAVSTMGDSLGSLSDAADAVALDIEDTFNTDIPSSVESSAINLTTKVGKFKAVGTTLGTELADGITGGIAAPAAALNIGTSLTNLIAISSKTLKGTAAAVGIGLAVSLVKNWVDGTNARKQEVIDAYNTIFTSIDVAATDTADSIRNKILDSFTFDKVVTDFGGGDINTGIDNLTKIADAAGIARSDIGLIVEYLQRGVTPETAEVAHKIHAITDDTEQWSGAIGSVGRNQGVVAQRYTESARLAQLLIDKTHGNVQEQNELNRQKRFELEFARETAGYAERQAAASDSVAQNTKDAAAAAADYAAHVASSVADAERIAQAFYAGEVAAQGLAAATATFKWLD